NALPLNSNTTTATTAAQWDWKRRALTVPLEAFVIRISLHTQTLSYKVTGFIAKWNIKCTKAF
ncbi:hypothetical protein, partial [Vibrio cholerae]|uniref:hypothetical protein n=1 Tax=Vibrio cholerae TaxID=666 RepID=UPI001964684B